MLPDDRDVGLFESCLGALVKAQGGHNQGQGDYEGEGQREHVEDFVVVGDAQPAVHGGQVEVAEGVGRLRRRVRLVEVAEEAEVGVEVVFDAERQADDYGRESESDRKVEHRDLRAGLVDVAQLGDHSVEVQNDDEDPQVGAEVQEVLQDGE